MLMQYYKEWPRFQASFANLPFDILEWRIDHLKEQDITKFEQILLQFKQQFPEKGLLLTYRCEQRGRYEPLQYEQIQDYLFQTQADYIDVEYRYIQEHPQVWARWQQQKACVLSAHFYGQKNFDFPKLLSVMTAYQPKVVKIAYDSQGFEQDANYLAQLKAKIQTEAPYYTLMAMGTTGAWTRKAAFLCGEIFVYASIGTCCSIEGQWTARQMQEWREELKNGQKEENQ